MSKFLVLKEYGLCIKADKVDGIQLKSKINETTNQAEYFITIYSRCVEHGFCIGCHSVKAANDLISYISDQCNIKNNMLYFKELQAPTPVKEEQKPTELPKNTEVKPTVNKKVEDAPAKTKEQEVNETFEAYASFKNQYDMFILLKAKGSNLGGKVRYDNVEDYKRDLKLLDNSKIKRVTLREFNTLCPRCQVYNFNEDDDKVESVSLEKKDDSKVIYCNDAAKTSINAELVKAFATFRNNHTQYIFIGFKGGTHKLLYNYENGLTNFENDIKKFEDAGIERLTRREYLKRFPKTEA